MKYLSIHVQVYMLFPLGYSFLSKDVACVIFCEG